MRESKGVLKGKRHMQISAGGENMVHLNTIVEGQVLPGVWSGEVASSKVYTVEESKGQVMHSLEPCKRSLFILKTIGEPLNDVLKRNKMIGFIIEKVHSMVWSVVAGGR